MTELELLGELLDRSEVFQEQTRWYVSMSMAVMVATYLGAQRLTALTTTIIIGMYLLLTGNHIVEVQNSAAYIADAYAELRNLSAVSDLSSLGVGVLEREGRSGMWHTVFGIMSTLFTVSFAFYCYKYVKESD